MPKLYSSRQFATPTSVASWAARSSCSSAKTHLFSQAHKAFSRFSCAETIHNPVTSVIRTQQASSHTNRRARYADALIAYFEYHLTDTTFWRHLPTHKLHRFWSVIPFPVIAVDIDNITGCYATSAFCVFELCYNIDTQPLAMFALQLYTNTYHK